MQFVILSGFFFSVLDSYPNFILKFIKRNITASNALSISLSVEKNCNDVFWEFPLIWNKEIIIVICKFVQICKTFLSQKTQSVLPLLNYTRSHQVFSKANKPKINLHHRSCHLSTIEKCYAKYKKAIRISIVYRPGGGGGGVFNQLHLGARGEGRRGFGGIHHALQLGVVNVLTCGQKGEPQACTCLCSCAARHSGKQPPHPHPTPGQKQRWKKTLPSRYFVCRQ